MAVSGVGALVLFAILLGGWVWLQRYQPRHRYCARCGAPMMWTETGAWRTSGGVEPPVIGYDPTSGRPVKTGWDVYVCTMAPVGQGHDMVWGDPFSRPAHDQVAS